MTHPHKVIHNKPWSQTSNLRLFLREIFFTLYDCSTVKYTLYPLNRLPCINKNKYIRINLIFQSNSYILLIGDVFVLQDLRFRYNNNIVCQSHCHLKKKTWKNLINPHLFKIISQKITIFIDQ
jgi:hypothetical protein